MVQSRGPLVDDVIEFMDGVLIPAECMDEHFEQNAFYCSYDCDTMVNNMFAYGPCSTQPYACIDKEGQSRTPLNVLHADAVPRHKPSDDQLARMDD